MPYSTYYSLHLKYLLHEPLLGTLTTLAALTSMLAAGSTTTTTTTGRGNVRVLGRVKHVHWQLQEGGALQKDRHAGVELRRERDQRAGAVEPALVAVPVVALFVALLGLGPLRERHARDEEEEKGDEEWCEDAGVQRLVGLSLDVAVGGRRHGNHEDGCTGELAQAHKGIKKNESYPIG